MFGSKGIKYLLFLTLSCALIYPAYSSDFDYAQTRQRITVQEEFGNYMAAVREKISKTWNPPDVLEEGHAVVIFKLDKNGNLVSSYIKESSGNSLYDESALKSIQKASPYLDFPENASREFITVVYSFDSSIVSTDYVKDLVQQADCYVSSNPQAAIDILNKAIKSIEGDPASYFLYARRYKLNKKLGNVEQAQSDLEECKRLKIAYDKRRIAKCQEALAQDETPFAYFTLANAYDLAGDYQNALYNIDKAISMTDLNHAYKRYRAEMIMRSGK